MSIAFVAYTAPWPYALTSCTLSPLATWFCGAPPEPLPLATTQNIRAAGSQFAVVHVIEPPDPVVAWQSFEFFMRKVPETYIVPEPV